MNGHTLGDILAQAVQANIAESEILVIPQVPRLPRSVETTAKNIENQFPITIEALVKSAEALEQRAEELRFKAERLLQNLQYAEIIREIVAEERDAWEQVIALAMVQPRAREEQV